MLDSIAVRSREPASVPAVKEFLNVFPDEWPSLPPAREIEFEIKVIMGTRPVSTPPYRMAPAGLKKLKRSCKSW